MIQSVMPEEVHLLRMLGIQTYTEAFGAQNTKEDLDNYLNEVFNPQTFQEEFENPNCFFYFYITDNREIVGYLKLNIDSMQTEEMGSNFLEVQRIYILNAFKGKGYGSELLTFAELKAREEGKKKIWLGVWEHNQSALQFYGKHKYKFFTTHSFFMGDDEQTDHILVKDIENGE